MKGPILLITFTFVLLTLLISSSGEKKGPQSMDEDTYNCVFNIAKGDYRVPVKERTTFDRKCYMRWYRHRKQFCVQSGKLYFQNRLVTAEKKKNRIIKSELQEAKGTGARRLYHRLKNRYTGITERYIQRTLSKDRTHQLLHKTFKNKPPAKPIIAYGPQERHQIDLMDVGKQNACTKRKMKYRYVLTIMDIFSRYVWLHALPNKSSRAVRKALCKTYQDHGTPRIIQCDQGTEFKGEVSSFAKKHKIKIIRSSPYHPQSQGKVERCHRVLRRKMAYDFITNPNAKNNWILRLPMYARAMNNDPKQPLGFKSSFQVYYGRPHNKDPSPKDAEKEDYHQRVQSLRKQVNTATTVNNAKLSSKHRGKYERFHVGDPVLAKTSRQKSKQYYRSHILHGHILKVGDGHRYFVEWKSAKGRMERKWMSVTEISRLNQQPDATANNRDKYYIPIINTDEDIFKGTGFSVRLNPIGDGSCQFAAVADQLSRIGIHRSPDTLRQEIVQYLRLNADTLELQNFVEDNDIQSYLNNMKKTATFGDHITLQAIANTFSINVQVVLPSGVDYCILRPQHSHPICTVQLGYLTEGNGDHYLSIWNPYALPQPVDDVNEPDHMSEGTVEGETIEETSVGETIEETAAEELIEEMSEGALVSSPAISSVRSPLHVSSVVSQQEVSSLSYPSAATSAVSPPAISSMSPSDVSSQVDPPDVSSMTDETAEVVCSKDGVINLKTAEREPTKQPTFTKKYIMDLPLEIMTHIFSYVVSVDVSSRQRLSCVCSMFKLAMDMVKTKMPSPAIHLAPHILDIINIVPETRNANISICRLLRAAGSHSGLALKLRSMLKIKDWHQAWLDLCRCTTLPGWFIIVRVYWRKKRS